MNTPGEPQLYLIRFTHRDGVTAPRTSTYATVAERDRALELLEELRGPGNWKCEPINPQDDRHVIYRYFLSFPNEPGQPLREVDVTTWHRAESVRYALCIKYWPHGSKEA